MFPHKASRLTMPECGLGSQWENTAAHRQSVKIQHLCKVAHGLTNGPITYHESVCRLVFYAIS
jgi:hypothetical protein